MTAERKYIPPDGMRGRIALRVAEVLMAARKWPGVLADQAKEQGLTPDGMLAACITEAVLKEIAKP